MKKMIITGRLGKEPENRHSPSGEWFVTFTVAVNVGTKYKPKTDWVDVSCNGKLAEIVKSYLKKGSQVLVEGYPSVNAYINKEGKPVATEKLNAKILEILSSKESSDNEDTVNYSGTKPNTDSDHSAIASDDIPF